VVDGAVHVAGLVELQKWRGRDVMS